MRHRHFSVHLTRPWLALIAWALPGLAAGAPGLAPAGVGWSAVELSASKFFLSATAAITLRERALPEVEALLLTPPAGRPVAPGPTVMEMSYDATLTGQHSVMTLLLDPLNGAALQKVVEDSGRRQRERRWRFTDIGAYHWTRRPANAKEGAQPPATWSDRSEGQRDYPGRLSGTAVTDPTGLIYALAAAPLRATGDRYEIIEFSRRHLHRVSAEVTGTFSVPVDYRERRGGSVTVRKTKLPALRIHLRGEAWPGGAGQDDEPFELLGLSGGIDIALDPVTRVPLQLSGAAPYVGQVTFRLKAATLR